MSYDPRAAGAHCDLCPLNGKADQVVVPPTPARSGKVRLVIVGEGPGRVEAKQGRGFVGPAGQLLDKVLGDFSRDDAWLTNAALCTAESDDDKLEAAACCSPRLYRELAALPPEAPILTLGRPAVKSVLNTKSLLLARGFVWSMPSIDEKLVAATERAAVRKPENALVQLKAQVARGRAGLAGRMVVPSIHPGFVLRAETWLPVLKVDIARVIRAARGTLGPLQDRGTYEVIEHVEDIHKLDVLGPVVAVDVETDGINPLETGLLCCGFSDGHHTFVVHPTYSLSDTDRRPAGRHEWGSFVPYIATWLGSRRVVMHNGYNFDQLVLRQHGIVFPESCLEDTLLAHHAFASHLPQKLDQVVSEYVDSGPWKVRFGRRGAEEKGLAPHRMPSSELVMYNAADCRLTALAWLAMQADLAKELAVYENDKKLAAVCREMQAAGIRMDREHRDLLAGQMKARATELLAAMRTLTKKKSFSPSKPGDVRKALFNRLHAKAAYRSEKTGLPGTGVRTLELLRTNETRAGRLSDMILDWRGMSKIRATYLDAIHLGEDSRQHPNWKPFGTVSGRLSCRLQSVPRRQVDKKTGEVYLESRVRECYVPAPGNVFVYFDVSQAEMRFAAYLSEDEKFIAEVESRDPYLARARQIFQNPPELDELDAKGKLVNKVGQELRQITKMVSLATNYLVEDRTLFAKMQDEGVNVRFHQVVAAQSAIRSTYRDYFNYVNRNVAFVQKGGYLRTPVLGRIRWFGFFPKPAEIANYPIQGGIADLMNLRVIELARTLPESAVVVAQIHDAIIIEVPRADVERTKALIAEMWARPIVLSNGRSLVLPVDLKTGERWSDL